MSPPGRLKGEYRRAQPEDVSMSPAGRPMGESRRAPPEGVSMSPPDRAKGPARSGPEDVSTMPMLRLSLQFADASHRALLARHRVQRWLRASLDAPAELTVRIVDSDEGRTLNRQFRRRDYATNVLTFNYERRPLVIADLVLCAPVVEREAREQGIDLLAHYAHLLVHGALHAQGMDHERPRDARVMQARETQVLAALGFADPYAR
jgi:probable rRNA maturation factor